tara:strand:+ start:7479 stop:8786 length:1308 start_codon:yes stop_codon:yes gene_type:complete
MGIQYKFLIYNIISLVLVSASVLVFIEIEMTFLSAFLFVFGCFFIALQCGLIAKYQDNQINIIRTLLSDDKTQRIANVHFLKNDFEKARQAFLSTQKKAEEEHELISSILMHLEFAVLIFDANTREIVRKNSKVDDILGRRIKQASDLGHLLTVIENTHPNIEKTITWQTKERLDSISLYTTIMSFQERKLKVVSMHSVHNRMLLQEQEAYKTLTKVLTHEVANSLTPLISISNSCQKLLPKKLSFATVSDQRDLTRGLEILERRATKLKDFVSKFKQLDNLPKPNLKKAKIDDIVRHSLSIFEDEYKQKRIEVRLDRVIDHFVMVDESQIEQVIINLIKNAIEAVETANSKRIDVKLSLSRYYVHIDISDYGPGVDKDARKMLFVPFFTTKREGSGIGLALSRQIMLSHGGSLEYIDKEEKTTFRCSIKRALAF